jgi:hypothetical protein
MALMFGKLTAFEPFPANTECWYLNVANARPSCEVTLHRTGRQTRHRALHHWQTHRMVTRLFRYVSGEAERQQESACHFDQRTGPNRSGEIDDVEQARSSQRRECIHSNAFSSLADIQTCPADNHELIGGMAAQSAPHHLGMGGSESKSVGELNGAIRVKQEI